MTMDIDPIDGEPLELVEPPTNLRHLVSNNSGSSSGGQIDLDAIDRADKAMERLSVSFDIWMDEEVEALRKAHEETREHGMTGDARQALFRVAHDLRGEAGTLGFPLVGQAAGSLADILSMLPEDTAIPENIVEAHVDAIHAMLREKAAGDSNRIAVELVNCLLVATRRLLEAAGALEDDTAPIPQESSVA